MQMPAIVARFTIMTLILVNFAILFSALAKHDTPTVLRTNSTAVSSVCMDGRVGSCTNWL
jgi:uncharacterized membrane protein YjfL (UPF0719 family)